MPTIKVSIGDDGRSLVLNDNGSTSGHSTTHGHETILWQVQGNDVKRIIDIRHKIISGSTNPFTTHSPRALDARYRIWQAQVDIDRPESVYVYSIKWEHKNGDIFDNDPIISIRPNTVADIVSIIGTLSGLVIGALATFIYRRKEIMRLNKENERLNRENEGLKNANK